MLKIDEMINGLIEEINDDLDCELPFDDPVFLRKLKRLIVETKELTYKIKELTSIINEQAEFIERDRCSNKDLNSLIKENERLCKYLKQIECINKKKFEKINEYLSN